jgi:pantoate--beta-alanine ligase
LDILRTITELRTHIAVWRKSGERVGLVPTMGALHGGHLVLVRAAQAECDEIVASIFVNPKQFAPNEDLASYPRREAADLDMLRAAGVGLVFMPGVGEMYPPRFATTVQVTGLTDCLCGAHRPGHFDGVATVVTKLFNIAQPHLAYFGQKDAQQAALVTRMARDLSTGIEIVVLPTVREPDGLALSSRNAYLSPPERQAATCLYRALQAANRAFRSGERDPGRLREAMCVVLEAEPLADPEYIEVVEPGTFERPGTLAVLAVRIGPTRLIDNHRLGEPLAGWSR